MAVTAAVFLSACAGDDGDARPDATDATETTDTTDAPDTTAGAAGEADGGTIYDTVAPGSRSILEPVALDAVAEFGNGVTARLTDVESVEVDAFMPGELSGPGVAITVELTNGSTTAIDLDVVAVELVATGDRYATLITTHENTHLVGELAPGASAEGTYVFTIAEEDRGEITVQVTYAAPEPTALFAGSFADA